MRLFLSALIHLALFHIALVHVAFCCAYATNPLLSLNAQEESADPKIAAFVNQTPITVASVEAFIKATFGERQFSSAAKKRIQIESLEHLIRRATIHDYLAGKKLWAGKSEVQLAVDQFEAQLARADISLAEHFKDKDTSLAQFKFETGWRISWARYLEKRLTDANLKKYFESKRYEFDGTKIKVAHLLLKSSSPEAWKQINDFHVQLTEAPENWNEWVAQYSDATSKDEGGNVGWISVDGPMPEAFTKVAFKLKTGEISKPVETSFGLHLVKCLETKPGKKGFLDARPEVVKSAKQYLFFKLANDHRKKVEVRFTGNWPHRE